MRPRFAPARNQQASFTRYVKGNLAAPVTETGGRSRPPADAVERPQGPKFVLDKRCKREPLRAARVADKEVVKERAQWRNSELRPHVEASRSSAAEGVVATFPARAADECNRVSGKKLSEEGEAAHGDLVREAKGKELVAWKSPNVFKPLKPGEVRKTAADARWVLT